VAQKQNKMDGGRHEMKKTAITEQKAGPKSTQGAFQASQSAHKQRGEVAERGGGRRGVAESAFVFFSHVTERVLGKINALILANQYKSELS
jgi:hypothetical protein